MVGITSMVSTVYQPPRARPELRIQDNVALVPQDPLALNHCNSGTNSDNPPETPQLPMLKPSLFFMVNFGL